jgi:general secretion pathway protein G
VTGDGLGRLWGKRLDPEITMRTETLEDWLPLKGRWLGYFLLALGWACRLVVAGGGLYLAYAIQPKFGGHRSGKGQVAATRAQLAAFQSALDVYWLDHGRFPTEEQGLAALVSPPRRSTQWKGPYLPDVVEVPQDAWKRTYHYDTLGSAGASYTICSLGMDGQPGGSDHDTDWLVSGNVARTQKRVGRR